MLIKLTSNKEEKMTKKIAFKILMFFVVLGILAQFSCKPKAGENGKAEKQLKKISVRLKWAVLVHVGGGEVVAKEKGFYKEEGLDVEIRPGGFEFDSIKTVPIGSDDIGVNSPDRIILARSRGIKLKAFMATIQDDPVVFFSRKESGIKEPKDFIGKKVGIKYGTNIETEYRAMMRSLGIDEKKVEEVPIKLDMALFFDGKVDVWAGYAVNEVVLAQMKGIDVNVIKPSDYGIPWYGNIYFTTETFMKENPDVLKRFTKATIRGWEYALDHPEETVEIVVKYDPKLDKELQLRAIKGIKDYILTDITKKYGFGWMDKQKWTAIQNVLIDQKIIENPISIDDIFTNQVLESINVKNN